MSPSLSAGPHATGCVTEVGEVSFRTNDNAVKYESSTLPLSNIEDFAPPELGSEFDLGRFRLVCREAHACEFTGDADGVDGEPDVTFAITDASDEARPSPGRAFVTIGSGRWIRNPYSPEGVGEMLGAMWRSHAPLRFRW